MHPIRVLIVGVAVLVALSYGFRGLLWSSSPTSSSSGAAQLITETIDCSGSWDEWTQCDATCGDGSSSSGQRRRVFRIDTFPLNGGAACPSPLVTHQTCAGLEPCNTGATTLRLAVFLTVYQPYYWTSNSSNWPIWTTYSVMAFAFFVRGKTFFKAFVGTFLCAVAVKIVVALVTAWTFGAATLLLSQHDVETRFFVPVISVLVSVFASRSSSTTLAKHAFLACVVLVPVVVLWPPTAPPLDASGAQYSPLAAVFSSSAATLSNSDATGVVVDDDDDGIEKWAEAFEAAVLGKSSSSWRKLSSDSPTGFDSQVRVTDQQHLRPHQTHAYPPQGR